MNATVARLPGLAADGLLALTLVGVPLAFTSAVREFSFLKTVVLLSLTGAATVFAAFADAGRRLPRHAGLVLSALGVLVAGTTLLRPTPDSVLAAGYLVACLLLVHLVATRAAAWPRIWWIVCLGVPLAGGLALSGAQAAGWGLLPATRAAFKTHHGLLVGSVGNPNENTWYLLLAAVLLAGFATGAKRRRLVTILVACAGLLVAAIILINRSRAALIALPLAGILFAAARRPDRRRWWLALGGAAVTALAVALVMQWGGERALTGRLYLARISAGMVVDRVGLPAGPGAFARDFAEAQADHLGSSPEQGVFYSAIDHAHCDPLEILYEQGLPGFALVGLLVLVARRGRRGRAPPAVTAALGTGLFLGLAGYLLFSPAAAVVWLAACGQWASRRPDGGSTGWSGRIPQVLAGCGLIVLAAFSLTGELRLTSALKAGEAGERHLALARAESSAAAWPSADALFYLGTLQLADDRPGHAAKNLEASYRNRPRPEVAHNLSLALDRLHRDEKARAWLNRARRLRPVP